VVFDHVLGSEDDILDVLIVGAGPAGLTAGYLLAKNGATRIAIVEENVRHVGGISRTEQHNGYLFDIGGHRFFSKSPEVEELWQEILPNDFIDRPRTSRIFYRNRFYSYPLRAFEALANLGVWESTLCVLSYIRARLSPVRDPTSFHQWVANQFGERLFGIFFKTYTEKVWGMSCDDISADWAAQRIKGLNLLVAILTALRKSMGVRSRGAVVKTLIETFRYPRRGPGMMWEAAARKIGEMGGRIILDRKVRDFVWNEGDRTWCVTAYDTSGARHEYRARHLVSSAPMRDVAERLSPPLKCRSTAAGLHYRDFLTVAIFLKSPPTFADNWIYIHDPGVKVGRVQNYTSWSPEMVPDQNKGCLGLEYFCFEGDDLWQQTDEALIELATRELEITGLAVREQIDGGYVVRQPKAYPVYDAHYKTIVDAIRHECAERFPTLHFVGRNGMHKYNNQDHAMMTAMLTARNILAGRRIHDVWSVNEDAQYHEELTSGERAALESERRVPQAIKR
jgi:protoporphyrinogen oxidase